MGETDDLRITDALSAVSAQKAVRRMFYRREIKMLNW